MHIMGEDNQSNMQEENGTEMERMSKFGSNWHIRKAPLVSDSREQPPTAKTTTKKLMTYSVFPGDVSRKQMLCKTTTLEVYGIILTRSFRPLMNHGCVEVMSCRTE